MIRILVIWNDSAVSQAVNNRAQDVWVETEHPNAEFIYIIKNDEPGNQALINNLQVTEYPTIIFAEVINSTDVETRSRIVGNASKQQIKNAYLAALNGEFGNGADGTTDVIIPGDDNESQLGLSFLLPSYMWLLIGATSGVMTAASKKPVKQLLFGGVTAVAFYNYFKNK